MRPIITSSIQALHAPQCRTSLGNLARKRLQPGKLPYPRPNQHAFRTFATSSVYQQSHSPPPAAPSKCHKSSPSEANTTACGHRTDDASPSDVPSTTPISSLSFWKCRHTWKRAGVNTTRCLIGCTTGDFGALWYLQAFHSDIGMSLMMGIPMAAGITTSLLLETLLLRFGRDRMPFAAAAKTAAGMSMVSMLAMESVETAVDWHLTGGVVDVGNPAFWGAALLAMGAGFAAPLPWNYYRLKRWGQACH